MIKGVTVAKGDMIVNGRTAENYFPGEVFKKMYQEAFRTTNTLNRFAISVTTSGGGLAGQLGAAIHGISRALTKVDLEKFRPILKSAGFLLVIREPRNVAKQGMPMRHVRENNLQSVNDYFVALSINDFKSSVCSFVVNGISFRFDTISQRVMAAETETL